MKKKFPLKSGKKQLLVSVIIPAHNGAGYIAETLDSVLAQTYPHLEIIVVNDGSADTTAAIVQKYMRKDSRVSLISYRKNRGESAAANLGFAASQGEFVARMDADDIAHPERIALQVAFLKKHLDYIVVGTQAHIIDDQGEIIGEKKFPTTHEEIYKNYGVLHPMLHPSIMLRRSLLPMQNKLWANKLEPNDDYYTLFQLLQHGKFANLPEKLMYYRMHENNKSLQDVKKKFLNSARIRFKAVRELGYPLTTEMIFKMLVQAVIVLSLPEFVTVGAYFWVRGMKPFHKAFPQVMEWKSKVRLLLSPKNVTRYAGSFLLVVLRQLFYQK